MPLDLLPLAIGIGLVVSLIFAETFGIAAGGMIVPGYLALFLERPVDLLLTLAAALVTYGAVRMASAFTVLFGRRRTVVMILVGYVTGGLLSQLGPTFAAMQTEDSQLIGYIIPGLIAIWLDRQGVVETLTALSTAAVLVRLVLLALVGLGLL